MKHTFKVITLLTVILSFYLGACKKEDTDAGTPPYISFNKGATYTYVDDTVAKGSTIKVGIIAKKSEANDILTKLTVVRTYDNTVDSVFAPYSVAASEVDSLSKDFTFTLRNISGMERYTFTIVNKDGIPNTLKLNITTN